MWGNVCFLNGVIQLGKNANVADRSRDTVDYLKILQVYHDLDYLDPTNRDLDDLDPTDHDMDHRNTKHVDMIHGAGCVPIRCAGYVSREQIQRRTQVLSIDRSSTQIIRPLTRQSDLYTGRMQIVVTKGLSALKRT